MCLGSVRRCSLFLGVLGLTAVFIGAAVAEPANSLPRLERICIVGNCTWGFDFEGRRGPQTPNLLRAETDNQRTELLRFYVFSSGQGANRPELPLRWDLGDTVLFNTYDLSAPPPRSPVIDRFRLAALVSRPDDGSGAGALDPAEYEDPVYCSATPMHSALHGFHHGWKGGVSRKGDPARGIHYDLRAVDDSTIEWFMTVDGELWRWTYDGCGGEKKCEWKNPKVFPARITKPFLILSDGKSLITEREGDWCVVQNFEQETDCVPLFTQSPGEPLTVIEDKTQQSHYFLHANSVRDSTGRELFAVRESHAHTDKVIQAVELLIKRRQP